LRGAAAPLANKLDPPMTTHASQLPISSYRHGVPPRNILLLYPTGRLDVHMSEVKDILDLECLNIACRLQASSLNAFRQSFLVVFLQTNLKIGFKKGTNLRKPSYSTNENANSCNTIILMSSLRVNA
jgi:hypothetical protein